MFEVCLFSMMAEMPGITLSEVLGVALGHLMITAMSQAIASLGEFSPVLSLNPKTPYCCFSMELRTMITRNAKQAFLCPYSLYRGQVTLDALTFDAYLQKFAQQAGFIAALHTSGKLSTSEAYSELANLWYQLSEAYAPVSPTLNSRT